MPTNILQKKLNCDFKETTIRIKDLLYGGGLYSYLKFLTESGECVNTITGHSESVESVAISPDGQTLVSGSEDKTIKIWQLNTGKLLHTLTGHSWAVQSIAISPDGNILASGSGDKTIRTWHIDTGKLLHTFSMPVSVFTITFSPDGKTLAYGSIEDASSQIYVTPFPPEKYLFLTRPKSDGT